MKSTPLRHDPWPPGIQPEAFVLMRFHWQLFITLTFRGANPRPSVCRRMFGVWLRKVARGLPQVWFPRIMWVVRYERGGNLQRGHLHACIAGLPSNCICHSFYRGAELIWRRMAHARSDVAVYEPARGGLAYILKAPVDLQHSPNCGRSSVHATDEEVPMLSESLMAAIERRM